MRSMSHVCTYVRMYACLCLCMYVCMYVCMRVSIINNPLLMTLYQSGINYSGITFWYFHSFHSGRRHVSTRGVRSLTF